MGRPSFQLTDDHTTAEPKQILDPSLRVLERVGHIRFIGRLPPVPDRPDKVHSAQNPLLFANAQDVRFPELFPLRPSRADTHLYFLHDRGGLATPGNMKFG